jgi:transcriptional regulator GlxA family with amidase domain
LRRIDEIISETLGDQINLEDLAASTSMSLPAFSTAMKATTGQTPYQYVLTRRVDRARGMVESTVLPLAQIAFRCGFSSQSHMTDVFRAKLGTTPGRLRADGV